MHWRQGRRCSVSAIRGNKFIVASGAMQRFMALVERVAWDKPGTSPSFFPSFLSVLGLASCCWALWHACR